MDDSGGGRFRGFVRGAAGDGGGVKDGDVGKVAGGEQALARHGEAGGGLGGDLVDGLFEGHPAALADDLAEEEGEGAVEAGVGAALDVEAVADDGAEGMGKQVAEVVVGLVEGEDVDVGGFGAEEMERGVDGMFAEGFADGGEVLADEAFADRGAHGGDEDVAPLLGGLLDHGRLHLAAEGGVGQAFEEGGVAAVEGPGGEELGEDGAAGEVGVAIESDVEPFVAGGFQLFEGLRLLGPVAAADGLEVGDLEAAAGRAGQRQLLVD